MEPIPNPGDLIRSEPCAGAQHWSRQSTILYVVCGKFIIFASLGQRDDRRKALPSGPSATTIANGSRPLIDRSYQSAAWSVSEHSQ